MHRKIGKMAKKGMRKLKKGRTAKHKSKRGDSAAAIWNHKGRTHSSSQISYDHSKDGHGRSHAMSDAAIFSGDMLPHHREKTNRLYVNEKQFRRKHRSPKATDHQRTVSIPSKLRRNQSSSPKSIPPDVRIGSTEHVVAALDLGAVPMGSAEEQMTPPPRAASGGGING